MPNEQRTEEGSPVVGHVVSNATSFKTGVQSDVDYTGSNCLAFTGTDYVRQANTLDFFNIGFKFRGVFNVDDTSGVKVLLSQQDGTETDSSSNMLYLNGDDVLTGYGRQDVTLLSNQIVAGTDYIWELEFNGTNEYTFTLNGTVVTKPASPVTRPNGDLIWGTAANLINGHVGRMWNCGLQAPDATRLDVIVTFGDSTNVGIWEEPPPNLATPQSHLMVSSTSALRAGDPWKIEGNLQKDAGASGLNNNWGAELELGRNITQTSGFIKVATSGSQLGVSWMPSEADYTRLVTTIEEGFQYFISLGYFPKIQFVTINLGSNDSVDLQNSIGFAPNFMTMWRNLCMDSYLNFNTPVMLMRANETMAGGTTYKDDVIASQDLLLSLLPNLTLRKTESYEKRDTVHYTSSAIIEQGVDQYEVYSSLDLDENPYHAFFSFADDAGSIAFNTSGNFTQGIVVGATNATQDHSATNIRQGRSVGNTFNGVDQYVNLLLTATEDTRVELLADWRSGSSIIGGRNGTTDLFLQNFGGDYACQFGDATVTNTLTQLNGIQLLSLSKEGISIDSASTPLLPYSFGVGGAMLLGAFSNGGTPASFADADIYYCKVWQDDVLVASLTPVDNGFYDSVRQLTLLNQGATALTPVSLPASLAGDYTVHGCPILQPTGVLHNGTESLYKGYTFSELQALKTDTASLDRTRLDAQGNVVAYIERPDNTADPILEKFLGN